MESVLKICMCDCIYNTCPFIVSKEFMCRFYIFVHDRGQIMSSPYTQAKCHRKFLLISIIIMSSSSHKLIESDRKWRVECAIYIYPIIPAINVPRPSPVIAFHCLRAYTGCLHGSRLDTHFISYNRCANT